MQLQKTLFSIVSRIKANQTEINDFMLDKLKKITNLFAQNNLDDMIKELKILKNFANTTIENNNINNVDEIANFFTKNLVKAISEKTLKDFENNTKMYFIILLYYIFSL
jgi:hypothetical protein